MEIEKKLSPLHIGISTFKTDVTMGLVLQVPTFLVITFLREGIRVLKKKYLRKQSQKVSFLKGDAIMAQTFFKREYNQKSSNPNFCYSFFH